MHLCRRHWFRLLLTTGLAAALPAGADNVILFIGDGAGLAQVAAARMAARGPDGRLAVDELEDIGLVTTHSASGLTTDSAAGATAYATGHKTTNGWLSVAPDGTRLKTLVEYAREAGMGTGIVTTTGVTHATPAAFAAHVNDRGAQAQIAPMMVATGPDVLLGGGRSLWLPKGAPGSERADSLDVVALAQQAGYMVVTDRIGLLAANPRATPRLLGLFALGHLSYVVDSVSTAEPSLAEMTRSAIDRLQHSRRGFFLMVEGGRIDHACHGHEGTKAIWEVLSLDQAIREAIDFAHRDRHTLVIFVADHETGGLSVANGLYDGFPAIPRRDGQPERTAPLQDQLKLGWTTDGHTGLPVIAMAAGPGAGRVRGVLDNTQIFTIAMQALGLEDRLR